MTPGATGGQQVAPPPTDVTAADDNGIVSNQLQTRRNFSLIGSLVGPALPKTRKQQRRLLRLQNPTENPKESLRKSIKILPNSQESQRIFRIYQESH